MSEASVPATSQRPIAPALIIVDGLVTLPVVAAIRGGDPAGPWR